MRFCVFSGVLARINTTRKCLPFYLASLLVFAMACRNPSKSADTFQLPAGFEIKLVAAEPLLGDPVDMEIDELGNMYVVEMAGNPLNQSGAGKVKLLLDENGDGKMDKSFLFADSLRMPSGVMRWKNGILVTDPPYVIYFEDTDRDNKADVKKILLEGFDASDLESNVNNPYYGLDNWIYVANGGLGGTGIRFASGANNTILKNNAGEHRVRFKPSTQQLEMLSGQSQFGHTEDIAGHSLLVENAIHIYEEVIPVQYLNRNPSLAVSSATELIADHSNKVFPKTINPENQLLTDVGVFTAACGITAYMGGAFGKDYDNAVFVCEPAHNLIHVDRLEDKGAAHSASRMDSAAEFLTSTDPWFRPVNLYIGPDGALYVVDYYRQFIEGPAFLSEEVLKTANLYAGIDKGRIYKIVKKDAASTQEPLLFNDSNLADKLSSKNIWWRKTAQRLIIDRQLVALVPELNNIIMNGQEPAGRLHALWTLEGLNQLTPNIILRCLSDSANFVRENAIKIAEQYYLQEPQIAEQLLKMADDKDARVRFQLLCSIGALKTSAAEELVKNMLFKYIDDPWMQIAALTSLADNKENILNTAINKFDKNNDAYKLLVERLTTMIASTGTSNEIYRLIDRAVNNTGEDNKWQLACLEGIAAGLRGRKDIYPALNAHRSLLVKNALHNTSAEIRDGSMQVIKITGVGGTAHLQNSIAEAVQIALNGSASQKTTAIQLLGLAEPAKHAGLFEKLINQAEPVTVQLAAINALGAVPGTLSSQFIVERWKTLNTGIQDEAINTFMVDRSRISILLSALQDGTIAKPLIGWPRSVKLMAGRWPKPGDITTAADSILIKKARTLLARNEKPVKELVNEYLPKPGAVADKKDGEKIFSENCGRCHQVNGKHGVKLGPDLSTVHDWAAPELVTKILFPQQSIKKGYELWDITLVSGEDLQGLIASETPNAITVNSPSAITRTIARKDIKSITSSGMTIMPEGFEKNINKEQMASLIAYLKND